MICRQILSNAASTGLFGQAVEDPSLILYLFHFEIWNYLKVAEVMGHDCVTKAQG